MSHLSSEYGNWNAKCPENPDTIIVGTRRAINSGGTIRQSTTTRVAPKSGGTLNFRIVNDFHVPNIIVRQNRGDAPIALKINSVVYSEDVPVKEPNAEPPVVLRPIFEEKKAIAFLTAMLLTQGAIKKLKNTLTEDNSIVGCIEDGSIILDGYTFEKGTYGQINRTHLACPDGSQITGYKLVLSKNRLLDE